MRRFRGAVLNAWTSWAACAALGMALAIGLRGGAQYPQQGHVGQPLGQRGGDPGVNDPFGDPAEQAKRLKMLNQDRQKAMVSDSGKLLKLATELDSELKGSNAESLTPQQLQKLATIERLAHSVREKMSYSMSDPGPGRLSPPFSVH
jgi:hypothetical protein